MRFCLLLCATLVAAPRIADACSPPVCGPGYFTPGDATTVPANLPAIYWRPVHANLGTAANDPTRISFSAASAPGTPLTFTAEPQPNGDYLLVPTAPLIAGETYSLIDHNTCDGQEATGPKVTFTATAAVPLPTSLGVMAASDEQFTSFSIATASGSCSANAEGNRADVAIDLASEASPWAAALHYATTVDDQPWTWRLSINDSPPPGSSVAGHGKDMIYDLCSSSDASLLQQGLAPGFHEVAMQATLPGSPVVLTSNVLGVLLPECTVPGDADEKSGGCKASGGAVGPLALAGLAMLVSRRRRRV